MLSRMRRSAPVAVLVCALMPLSLAVLSGALTLYLIDAPLRLVWTQLGALAAGWALAMWALFALRRGPTTVNPSMPPHPADDPNGVSQGGPGLLQASSKRTERGFWALVLGSVALLWAAALLGERVEGVRRWIRLGPLLVHTAALVTPVLVCVLARWAVEGRWKCVAGVSLASWAALLAQPDAGYGCALMLAMAWSVASSTQHRRWAWLPALLALVSWWRDWPVTPVGHTEGVVGLAAQWHLGLAVWDVAALALATGAPWTIAAWRRSPDRAVGVGSMVGPVWVVMACTALWPLVGHWPVPWVGFGASPVLGACLGLGVLAAALSCAPQSAEPDGQAGG